MSLKTISQLLPILLIALLFSCTNNYKQGIREYHEKNYYPALTYLKSVKANEENYDSAQIKIAEIKDTLAKIKTERIRQDSIARIEQFKRDSLSNFEKEREEFEKFQAQLKREIESFKTFDGGEYRNEVTSIQIEVALFNVWGNLIKKAKAHKNPEINKLGKTLNYKVSVLQKKRIPTIKESLW